ncbi:MAG: hypothetical protein LAP40_13035 [Acidobacteriia bacterium]|nr:hypothetical protein [Terriglobia bacterium]
MNDTELDRLLDSWEAPAAPSSLRQDLRAHFPRPERREFLRPLRWALAIGVASVALAVGVAQTSESQWNYRVVRVFNQIYEHLQGVIEVHQVTSIVAEIRKAEPKVYVDGQLVAPLEFGRATLMDVQVAGDGVYSITLYRNTRTFDAANRPTGWVQSGHFHGSVIEFRAGVRQVRIECSKPIVDSDRPVFVRRRTEGTR